jgi:hypothetical protein
VTTTPAIATREVIPWLLAATDHDGTPLAARIHDRSLPESPNLLEGVSVAAALRLEDARPQAGLKTQLREVRAPRQRAVGPGDQERRRSEGTKLTGEFACA